MGKQKGTNRDNSQNATSRNIGARTIRKKNKFNRNERKLIITTGGTILGTKHVQPDMPQKITEVHRIKVKPTPKKKKKSNTTGK